MPDIGYFEIPADNIDRAKYFYHALIGWKIEPTRILMNPPTAAALQYNSISTGPAQEGTLNMGEMYRQQMTETIKNFVLVNDFDKVPVKAEMLGGRIVMPKTEIHGVGPVAIIQDTEGNGIGLWKLSMKE
jgi:predicted enzyme related to lactoylglutathione lyase